MSYLLEIAPYILEGFKTTLTVFIITLVTSIPLGMLVALLCFNANKFISSALNVFTWIIRGTPLVLQLYVIVFGLPLVFPGFFTRDALIGATITFIINYTAYFIEIFRGGLLTIPKGQWEAAKVLQISKFNTIVRIIIPQMIRSTLYSISNECISLVKDTSLVTVVGVGEIFRNAKEIMNRDLRVQSLFIVAVIYLLLTFVVIKLFKRIEKKLRMEYQSL